jgi:histidinol-phosphate aminotransferase
MSRFFELVSGNVRSSGNPFSPTPAPPLFPSRLPTASTILLASNESPYGPSSKAVAAAQAVLADSHRYPSDEAADLKAQLAAHHAVEPDQIVISAGATALLGIIARTMLEPGLNAVTSACSFVVYGSATRAAGGELREIPMKYDRFDLEAMLAAIDGQTRVVYVANPNNPTGTIVSLEELEYFVSSVPSHVVVVLDEAYYEYAQHFSTLRKVPYSRSLDLVHQGKNVVVVRTFSKTHGLAALRIGYGIGPSELMGYFAGMQDTFAVSSAAQAAAGAALADAAHIAFAVENNAKQVEWLGEELARMGLRVLPTFANFVCVDFLQDTEGLTERLRDEQIMVRPLGGVWGAPTCIRVTVGTAEQNQAFIHALHKILAG